MDVFSPPGALFTRAWLFVVALAALMLCVDVGADVSDADRHEIQHLLEYLRTSGCAMERNGEKHDSEDASSHVQKKYDYFRSRIQSTEDFINYSASKSTMSSKYYLVHCEGQPAMRTRDWLLEELHEYREKNRVGRIADVAGAYVFGHEVRSFQPCGSSKIYWVRAAKPEVSASLRERHEELGTQPYGRIYVVLSGTPADEDTTGFARSFDGYFDVSRLLGSAGQFPADCDVN